MRRLMQSVAIGMVVFAGVGVRGAVGQSETSGSAAVVTAPAVAAGGTIRGTVKAGAVPLPGVAVTATNTLTGKKYATTTDVAGMFAMTIPRDGRYVVKAELTGFAAETKEVLINAAGLNGGAAAQVAEFGMQLASRVAREEAQQASVGSALAGALGRGTQALSVSGDGVDAADASAGGGNAGVQMPSLGGLGGADAAASDSVTVSGQMGQTNGLANFNEDEIRQRVEEAVARARQQGGAAGDMANAVVGGADFAGSILRSRMGRCFIREGMGRWMLRTFR